MSVPTTNADGKPAIDFTEEQKFIFDTRGWIAIPDVLTDDEIEETRDFCYRLKREPESIPNITAIRLEDRLRIWQTTRSCSDL